jgi:pteridine reductase
VSRPRAPRASRSKGRVALVTGAGKRVGKAIAQALAAEGATVAVHYNGSATGARETVQAIRESGGDAHAFRANLMRAGEPAKLVDAVVAHFGRLDILVNSAASMRRTTLATVRERDWDEVFALNLRAPFFCALAAARAMRRRGGVVVNISDHMGFESWPDFVPHGVSKAGVAAMTHALAAALAPRVRVNAVAPGFVLAPTGYSAAKARTFTRETPLKRLGTPDDVARAVCYLACAPYVTGEVLFVDGGRHGAR